MESTGCFELASVIGSLGLLSLESLLGKTNLNRASIQRDENHNIMLESYANSLWILLCHQQPSPLYLKMATVLITSG